LKKLVIEKVNLGDLHCSAHNQKEHTLESHGFIYISFLAIGFRVNKGETSFLLIKALLNGGQLVFDMRIMWNEMYSAVYMDRPFRGFNTDLFSSSRYRYYWLINLVLDVRSWKVSGIFKINICIHYLSIHWHKKPDTCTMLYSCLVLWYG